MEKKRFIWKADDCWTRPVGMGGRIKLERGKVYDVSEVGEKVVEVWVRQGVAEYEKIKKDGGK